jgi:hypothetical protein
MKPGAPIDLAGKDAERFQCAVNKIFGTWNPYTTPGLASCHHHWLRRENGGSLDPRETRYADNFEFVLRRAFARKDSLKAFLRRMFDVEGGKKLEPKLSVYETAIAVWIELCSLESRNPLGRKPSFQKIKESVKAKLGRIDDSTWRRIRRRYPFNDPNLVD